MRELLVWWFYPKRFSSIVKIPIGILTGGSFFSTLLGNIADFIHALSNPPLYIDLSYLLLPTISSFFADAILWGGLFYLPYFISRQRSKGRKKYLMLGLLVVLIMGSGFAGAVYTKPGTVEITRTQLALLEARLGEVNKMGEFYTVREFGYDVAELTEPLPDLFISEAEGFSDLVIFYQKCEAKWWEYDILPSVPSSIREDWRKAHIEEEAMMLFWGKTRQSVFYKGTKDWERVKSFLLLWFTDYKIDRRMHPAFANWTLPPK